MIVGKLMVILGLDSKGFNTGLNTATKKTSLFAKATDKTFKLLSKAVKISMVAIGAAMVKGAIDSAKFEKSLANVSTMLDKTTMPLMKDFRKGMLELSEEYGEATDTLANGLYDILSASIPAAKAMNVLKVSAIAAKAGLTDTGVAADAITTLMNSFGDATKDATFFSDILFATVKRGKCLTGDTRVLLSNGEYRRIDSLSGDVSIVSWDYKTFTPTEAKFIDMGTKQTVEIETKNGRQITTTPEHPYLTVNGWKKVSELKEGDKIAVPTSLPFFGDIEPEEGFAELLGLLLAEGSLNGSTPKLTIGNEHTDKIAKEATEKYGIGYNKINQTNDRCPQYCLSYGKAGYNNKNKLTGKLRSMGIWGDTCYTKKVPEEVFTWKKEYIAKFLNAYFTGDGWLCHSGPDKKTWQLGACSVSKELLNDISHLLLRFGINGTIRKNSNNAYIWATTRFIEIKRFLDFIGIQRNGLEDFNNYIPMPTTAQLNGLTSSTGVQRLRKEYRRYRGVKSEGNLLEYVAIKRIEYKEVERVYDLMVPLLHNFVANDILAHNTTFAELAPVIGNVAKLMETAGGTAEDMAAMLSIMTRNGIQTRVAVTSLRGVVSALLKPSEALTEFLGDMTVEADGFAAVMEKVSSLPAVDLAELFPNVRALTGVVVAAGDLAEELEIIGEIMNTGAGPSMEAFEKQTKTLAFLWAQLKSTLTATSIAIGDKLLPTIKELFIDLNQWLKDNREGFANFASSMLNGIKGIVAAIVSMKDVLLSLGIAVVGVMAVQKVTVAMKALGIATSVSLGPIAAIGAAVGLLITGFFNLRRSMRKLKEEEELVDDASKGVLQTTEDYNDAIDIQQAAIDKIIATRKAQTEAIENGLVVQGRDEKLAREGYESRLRNAQGLMTTIKMNAAERKQIDDAEKARVEEMSATELQAHFDKMKIEADELAAEQTALALQKQKQATLDMVADALMKASETQTQRYNRELKELKALGVAHQDALDYLAIQYPEALDEADTKITEFWGTRKAEVIDFTEVAKTSAEKMLEAWNKTLDSITEKYNAMYSSISGVGTAYFDLRSKQLDLEESQGKDVAKKRAKLARDQFFYEKVMSLSQIAINTAVAATAALPNVILSGIVIALGAIQAALVVAEKPPPMPSFIRGGVNGMIAGGAFRGNPGIDTNQVALTSGEYIMPPQQTNDNIDELEAMRAGGAGGKSVVVNPMPLNISIGGKNVFRAMVEFLTPASDRGEFRINPKVIGANT